MRARTISAYASAVIVTLVGYVLLVAVVVFGVRVFADHVGPSSPSSPGAEWQHMSGSIYWTCTRDGHALIKDADTGSTMLARDDRKCDSGG